MTDEQFQDLEHKLDKADDDLGTLTKDTEKLKVENAKLRASVISLVAAFRTLDGWLQPSVNVGNVGTKRSEFAELLREAVTNATLGD